MRYAVIADVHGNYPALKAVLDDAEKAGAQRYLLAGDYITDFPYTREVYELLRELPNAVIISGNREQYMGRLDPAQRHREQTAGLFLTEEALGEDGLAWARSLPQSAKLETPDGKRTIYLEHCCEELYRGELHGGTLGLYPAALNLAYPQRGATRQEVLEFAAKALAENPELPRLKERTAADVVVHGHSHLQYAVEAEGVLYLNPGSCGIAHDYQPGAPYTLLSYENGGFSVEERRVEYDRERAVREWRQSPGYRETEVWSEMAIFDFLTVRDHHQTFFEILDQEQQKAQPQTDEEHNRVFRRAFQRARELWEGAEPHKFPAKGIDK